MNINLSYDDPILLHETVVDGDPLVVEQLSSQDFHLAESNRAVDIEESWALYVQDLVIQELHRHSFLLNNLDNSAADPAEVFFGVGNQHTQP